MDGPKHPRARIFTQRKFFDCLTSFSDLEARISALPTNQERGDAFEVFTEGYLATQPIARAKTVWPFDAIPLPVKKRLALGMGRDMGVDGVFETRVGEYNAYQVKFRSGRPSLTWDELSTFMGLTDQVTQRVIITNCDDLPSVINERKGFYCIRGNDLDKLEATDFEAIQFWLLCKAILAKRKEPLPHQQEALDAVLPALKKHDRATVLMPCGTGKTLLTLWAAEQLGCRNVLVMVPSLALLRQTLHEWLKETKWKAFSCLCVCSDPTVARDTDEVVVRQSDVDFPVTTESITVRKFLQHGTEGVKVVFSTYQSARVVAEGLGKNKTFELGIFDEAHKTAGREGANFSFALKDETLPITRRLFLTATPRHFDVSKRDKEGDAKLVYSMDVPEVYGLVTYQLSFVEAVKRDIICDYKVIVSVVTSKMVNDELLRCGEVVVEGYLVRARQVSNQITLKHAIEAHGVCRVITFHKTVASAASFTSKEGQGLRSHLPEIEGYHVNGAMPTARREQIMSAFRGAKRAAISNARCLTEGVDVPVVDMVAFLTPKRSKVDIVQATGRAMRKSEATGKTIGYVLVPLFIEQAIGESVEDAVARAEFDEVWAVLQAMQEQDEVLADVIRQMREDRGRTKGFDDGSFREKVEVLGPGLSLDTLRRSITTRIIDRIGRSWDERFGELQAYKEQFGHCSVPAFWSKNHSLGKWVVNQRQSKRQGNLTQERFRRLEKIGFVWDPIDAFWEERFAELVRFKQKTGHCNVPYSYPDIPELGVWVRTQRINRRRGNLSEGRLRRLEEIGFVWDPIGDFAEERFVELVQFKAKTGHCNVPRRWAENPRLATWVDVQRHARKNNKLSEEHIQRLEAIGFIWEPFDTFWEERYAELIQFKAKTGHCNVPIRWSENPTLATWLTGQRQAKKKGKLPEDRLGGWEKMVSRGPPFPPPAVDVPQ